MLMLAPLLWSGLRRAARADLGQHAHEIRLGPDFRDSATFHTVGVQLRPRHRPASGWRAQQLAPVGGRSMRPLNHDVTLRHPELPFNVDIREGLPHEPPIHQHTLLSLWKTGKWNVDSAVLGDQLFHDVCVLLVLVLFHESRDNGFPVRFRGGVVWPSAACLRVPPWLSK